MSDLVGAYLAHLRAGGYSSNTIRDRGYVLRRIDRQLPQGLPEASVEELEAELGRWSGWTLYTYYEALTSVFSWWARRGFIDWDPTTELIRPRPPVAEPRPVDSADVVRALTLPRPWRTAILLAYLEGLRVAEICRLRRQDITRQWLTVLRKGGRRMQLPTHPDVWAEVLQLPPGPVVVTRAGGQFRPKNFGIQMSKRLQALGLHGVTLHRFRHSFGTLLFVSLADGGAGASARTAQELLGHASLASTQIYAQVTEAQRRRAIEALRLPGEEDAA